MNTEANPIDKTIYDKLSNFCAYQERCVSDVKEKMRKLKVEKQDYDGYIEKLKDSNFLNEERFVKYYVSAHAKRNGEKQK